MVEATHLRRPTTEAGQEGIGPLRPSRHPGLTLLTFFLPSWITRLCSFLPCQLCCC